MIQVVAHRGIAATEPENTLRGFRRAVELGAEWTECDVRLTGDGRLVVMHDETVDRTTNGAGKVLDLTFERIRALDAGKGERVPTLEEVLAVLKGRLHLHLELKAPGVEQLAVGAVKGVQMDREVQFTSVDLGRLRNVKEMDPSLDVGAIFGEPSDDCCQQALDVGAGSVHIFYKNMTRGLVEQAHRLGLAITAWSPDLEPEWRAMMALGVDLICTNRPDRLIAMLRADH